MNATKIMTAAIANERRWAVSALTMARVSLRGSRSTLAAAVESSTTTRNGDRAISTERAVRTWHEHCVRSFETIREFVESSVLAIDNYPRAVTFAASFVRVLSRAIASEAYDSPSFSPSKRSTIRAIERSYRRTFRAVLRLVARNALSLGQGRKRPVTPAITQPTTTKKDFTATPKKTYRCAVCDRVFRKTFHYLQHIRVHYRLNMYNCSTCDRAFVQQNGLNYHEAHCCDGREQQRGKKTHKRKRRRKSGDNDDNNCASSSDYPTTTTTTLFEACDGCGGAFYINGPEMRNHVVRCHAARNIDLGINREQQHTLLEILQEIRPDVLYDK